MLTEISKLIGYKIEASDGPIGSVNDVLFDDASWTIRWLVVDTGTWLPGRLVLLPASVLGQPNSVDRSFPVRLTRAAVKDSPDTDSHRPVSRQFETSLYDYYGWTPYWGAGYFMGGYGVMGGMVPMGAGSNEIRDQNEEFAREAEASDGPHLRSANAVTGDHLQATDGEIGHLSGILFNEADWSIRFLIVDTSNWWLGKRVLISPRSATYINWTERLINLDVSRDKVKASPGYDEDQAIDRAYEDRMAAHYGPTVAVGTAKDAL